MNVTLETALALLVPMRNARSLSFRLAVRGLIRRDVIALRTLRGAA